MNAFSQYDGIAYPRVDSKSIFTKLYERVVGGTEKSLPNQSVMQSLALKVYLKEYKDILCDFKFSTLDAQSITKQIMDIFHSVHSVHHCVDNIRWSSDNTFLCQELPEVCAYRFPKVV